MGQNRSGNRNCQPTFGPLLSSLLSLKNKANYFPVLKMLPMLPSHQESRHFELAHVSVFALFPGEISLI